MQCKKTSDLTTVCSAATCYNAVQEPYCTAAGTTSPTTSCSHKCKKDTSCSTGSHKHSRQHGARTDPRVAFDLMMAITEHARVGLTAPCIMCRPRPHLNIHHDQPLQCCRYITQTNTPETAHAHTHATTMPKRPPAAQGDLQQMHSNTQPSDTQQPDHCHQQALQSPISIKATFSAQYCCANCNPRVR